MLFFQNRYQYRKLGFWSIYFPNKRYKNLFHRALVYSHNCLTLNSPEKLTLLKEKFVTCKSKFHRWLNTLVPFSSKRKKYRFPIRVNMAPLILRSNSHGDQDANVCDLWFIVSSPWGFGRTKIFYIDWLCNWMLGTRVVVGVAPLCTILGKRRKCRSRTIFLQNIGTKREKHIYICPPFKDTVWMMRKVLMRFSSMPTGAVR